VLYSRHTSTFPSDTTEEAGYFVGFGEHVGDAMTFKVLSKLTNKIIYRSNVRTASSCPNFRLSSDGETDNNIDHLDKCFIQSKSENLLDFNGTFLPDYSPTDLLGRIFSDFPAEDGVAHKIKIIKLIADHKENIKQQPATVKYMAESLTGGYEKILNYNDILNFLERDNHEGDLDTGLTGYKDIIGHQGPLNAHDPNYKGSRYNVQIEWNDGDITYEPLDIIASDDPVTCAVYAKRNNLLDCPGWKRFKRLAREIDETRLIINKAKLIFKHKPQKFKYGFQVPTTHQDAMMLDKKERNNLWQEAESKEIQALMQYNVFKDLGKGRIPPTNYKKIRCHMVYDIKHDGRHKGRLVAGGHLTPIPTDSVYSGVISLRALRLVAFLAELNKLQLWGADVSIAYLEADTREEVYLIAGDEFGILAGHTLIVEKALYGLQSSGLRWHEKFADILRDIGFTNCRAEPDIWMRQQGDIYEYIGVYVDDLAIAAKDPDAIIKLLEQIYKFGFKGVGPLKFHIGCDFNRDNDGILSHGPKTYIDKMMVNYERMFGNKPKEYSSPLEKNDHPELDDSELLNEEGITQYQSMVGAAQWAVSLGRFDIQTAIMSMSRYRIAPRVGHLERMKHIYGYLRRFKEAAIRVRINQPDLSQYPIVNQDWLYSEYGKVTENIPLDIPTPLGQSVVTTHYGDANLHQNQL
jgi:Reverse transcriptase (RNA-dependent DNA polymerase)